MRRWICVAVLISSTCLAKQAELVDSKGRKYSVKTLDAQEIQARVLPYHELVAKTLSDLRLAVEQLLDRPLSSRRTIERLLPQIKARLRMLERMEVSDKELREGMFEGLEVSGRDVTSGMNPLVSEAKTWAERQKDILAAIRAGNPKTVQKLFLRRTIACGSQEQYAAEDMAAVKEPFSARFLTVRYIPTKWRERFYPSGRIILGIDTDDGVGLPDILSAYGPRMDMVVLPVANMELSNYHVKSPAEYPRIAAVLAGQAKVCQSVAPEVPVAVSVYPNRWMFSYLDAMTFDYDVIMVWVHSITPTNYLALKRMLSRFGKPIGLLVYGQENVGSGNLVYAISWESLNFATDSAAVVYFHGR